MQQLGLNLSDSSIEIAEVRQGWFGRPQLVGIGRSLLPAGAVEQGIIQQLDLVVEQVKVAARQAQATATAVVVSVPEAQVYSRVLRFPKTVTEGQLRHTIQMQFSDYLPFEITEVSYDYIRLGLHDDQIDLLLVAVPHTVLRGYTDLCQRLGYQLQALELESISSARAVCFPEPSDSNSVLVLDLGASTTIASWFDRYGLRFTFNHSVAGQALTDSLVAGLSISVSEAEQLKQHKGLTGQAADSMQQALQPLLTQIREGMNYVEQSAHLHTNKILLIGGTAQLPGLATWLQDQLGVAVELATLLPELSTNDILKQISGQSIVYSNAIGLALGGSKQYQSQPRINFYRV